jgi:hypothetical protein
MTTVIQDVVIKGIRSSSQSTTFTTRNFNDGTLQFTTGDKVMELKFKSAIFVSRGNGNVSVTLKTMEDKSYLLNLRPK